MEKLFSDEFANFVNASTNDYSLGLKIKERGNKNEQI